jgi:16S rRNA G1207 methylase RsmC
MLPNLLKGLRVLDLGCGFGSFARKARRRSVHEIYDLLRCWRIKVGANESEKNEDHCVRIPCVRPLATN